MPTNRVALEEVLLPDEHRGIEEFCMKRRGVTGLPDLAAFLHGAFSVLIELDQDIVAGYATDQSNLPGHAVGLARPANERECAILLCALSAAGIPVTVSAGRTNLTGSATPEGGMVLSLERMYTPEVEVDRHAKTVTSPVGIILEDMRRIVLERCAGRLFFPVDPTSRCDAMVGGALSCNASGFTPGEAGAMRPWVRSLRIITPGGLLVRAARGQYVSRDGIFLFTRGTQETPVPVPMYARPAIKNASGPFSSPEGTMDLVDLMVGSEGIFALITGCCLALSDRPEEYLDLFVSLAGEQDALRLLQHLRDDLPLRFSALSACEYFGPHCREFMVHEHRFFGADHQVGVYLQVALAGKTLDEEAGEWLKIMADAPCSIDEDAVMVLLTDRDRTVFFEARHSLPANSLELVRERGTHTVMTDTVVPPALFEPFLAFAHDLLRSSRLDHLVFGHLGDCHLHFMIMPGKEQMDSALAVYDRIVEKSAELGGIYSGEHGTGKRKRGDFLKCHGKEAAEQILLTKRALDPNLILNPGNVVVPSLLQGHLHVPGLI